jgi:hypothetical protein
MDDKTTNKDVIQDWTDTQVPLLFGDSRDVKYKVFKDGARLLQEIRDTDGTLIRKLVLPEGMVLGKISLETSVRYALVDVTN